MSYKSKFDGLVEIYSTFETPLNDTLKAVAGTLLAEAIYEADRQNEPKIAEEMAEKVREALGENTYKTHFVKYLTDSDSIERIKNAVNYKLKGI